MTDTASAASEGAASEGAASEGAAPVNSAVQGGVPGEDSGTKGLSNLKGVSNSQPADAGRIVELSDLRVSRRVKPDYPAIARKRREEGTVTLLITLEGANVLSVKVEKSSGFSALDEAAAAAVRRWRFEPDSRARSRRIQARVPVTFRLKP
jgi:protein TonB